MASAWIVVDPDAWRHDVAGVELAEAQPTLEDVGQVVVEQAARRATRR